jgi:hypothetical protein
MRFDFCVACGRRDNLNHHHMKPRVHGGSDDDANMITLCRECHGIMHNAEWSLDHVELVKAGQAKAQQRTAAEWRTIARQKRQQAARAADRAKAMAQEAEDAAAMEAEETANETQQARDAAPPPSAPVQAPDRPAVHLMLVASNPERRASDAPKPALSVITSAAQPRPRHLPSSSHNTAARMPRLGIPSMQHDKRFRIAGDWALASDGVQWVIQRSTGKSWQSVSFVHTSKDILARCMADKGTPASVAERLLAGLPDCFEAWHEQFHAEGCPYLPGDDKNVMTGLEGAASSLAA